MAAREGQVLLEHGFVPDCWQHFSDPGEALWEAGQFFFLKLREVNEFFANLLISLDAIPADDTYSVGVDSGKTAKHQYPPPAGYVDPDGDFVCYRDHYAARLARPHADETARVAVIGHTHRPFMEMVNGGEQLFIDAGAWTVGRSDFAVLTREEAAICTYRRR
jgi:UDP-2,3-diacylglucosamine pyrophosphatase LpxH